MPPDTMRERFARVTTELLDENERIAVVLAEISVDRFASAARTHPARMINVGIREQLLVSVAGGLALTGMRPFVHTYAPFLIERPFEQLKLDLGHQDVGAVLVSIGASYDSAESGRTHHSPGDVALVATLPDWVIEVPGHPDETERALRRAATSEERVYIRLSERSNAESFLADRGLTVIRRGTTGTVLAVGPMLAATLEATSDLDVTILYTSTVRPLDEATLRATLAGEAIVLVEPSLAGTSGAAVSTALSGAPHRLLALGVPNIEHRHYGTPAEHDAAHGLDAAGLRGSITAFLPPVGRPRAGERSTSTDP
jgi:transketolase